MWNGLLAAEEQREANSRTTLVHQLTAAFVLITIKNLQPCRNNDSRSPLLNQKNLFAAGFNTKCTFEGAAALCSLELDIKASLSLCAHRSLKYEYFVFTSGLDFDSFITEPEKIHWEKDQKKTQKARKLISGYFVHFGSEWRKSVDETPSTADYIKTWQILVFHVFMAVMESFSKRLCSSFRENAKAELNQVWKRSSVLMLGWFHKFIAFLLSSFMNADSAFRLFFCLMFCALFAVEQLLLICSVLAVISKHSAHSGDGCCVLAFYFSNYLTLFTNISYRNV